MAKGYGLLGVLMLFSGLIYAQDSAQTISPFAHCRDTLLHRRMVKQNATYTQQGFKVMLFKVLYFPKKSLVPQRIHLTAGKNYQINFVPNRLFKKAEITVLGRNRQVLFKRKLRGGDDDQKLFSRPIVAPYSGDYWIILSESAKGRDMVCGGLSVLAAQETK